MNNKKTPNPFANKGRIISSHFIGRIDGLRTLANTVTEQPEPNNLAIIGYPRIGKSSLAWKAIGQKKEELWLENKIAIWIDLSSISNRDSFFKELVRTSFNALKKRHKDEQDISDLSSQVLEKNNHWDDVKNDIEAYFETLTEKGYHCIFVLDEFDEARIKFKNNTEAFRELRHLGYNPEQFGVAFVTTSRRRIREIELQSEVSSNLDGIFGKKYLAMYNTDEMEEYYQLYNSIGLSLTNEQKQRIEFYCGNHPFLLAVLGFEIVETFSDNSECAIDIDAVFQKIQLEFNDHYELLINLLKEDNTYITLLQVLASYKLFELAIAINELKIYGLVKEIEPNIFKAFSEHFELYLKAKGKEIDFWYLWSESEVMLRHVIKSEMIKKYNDQWLAVLQSRHKEPFDKAKTLKDRQQPAESDENILDYFDPGPIFEVLFHNKGWNDFKHIFGGDKTTQNWKLKSGLIIQMRNAFGHNRSRKINDLGEVEINIDPFDILQAERYCKDFLEKLNAYT